MQNSKDCLLRMLQLRDTRTCKNKHIFILNMMADKTCMDCTPIIDYTVFTANTIKKKPTMAVVYFLFVYTHMGQGC